jgi:hypothetical protein
MHMCDIDILMDGAWVTSLRSSCRGHDTYNFASYGALQSMRNETEKHLLFKYCDYPALL